ncbi:hypothetical protein BV25DRAFT_1836246 [Artomyces pyxidatus]|uniref:Uncharacterized protein n=1 Tax=Artomyces pyxidatus TaxID=48021 RepID=A0ACB8TBM6_9AGAM|nr:hypothetical protein BV25DRAFT_1836246 [Artomyces pyxidatus]
MIFPEMRPPGSDSDHSDHAKEKVHEVSEPARKAGKPSSKNNNDSHHNAAAESHPNAAAAAAAPAAEVSAVPNPVPDTGPTSSVWLPATIHSSPLFQATPPPTSAPLSPSSALIPPTIPPIAVFASSHSMLPSPATVDTASLSVQTAPTSTDASGFNQSTVQQATSHRSTVAVTLLAVGGVCLLAAVFVIIKICSRPKRRSHPTPSLPILQDSPSTQEKGDESPLFGGKERFSSRPASNAVLWTWTQYQSGIPKPAPAATSESAGAGDNRRYSRLEDRNALPASAQGSVHQATTATYAQPTVQLVPEKVPRNMSRLSTMSVSAYPATTYMPPPGQDIGVAVTSGLGLGRGTDEHHGVTRKPSAGDYGKRASVRRSMRDFEKRRSVVDTLAYATSSPMPQDAAANGDAHGYGGYAQGRARIKAPYGAGSYLRASTSTGAPKRSSTMTDMNPFSDEAAYAVPPMPSMERGRDAKGGAAGQSVSPPSPDLTLYPDDSLSVAGDKRRVPHPKKAQGQIKSPAVEASAALGNLMLSDYRASKMSPAMDSAEADDRGSLYDYESSFTFRKRADDKPPRVPSPPPMPSLAQMAMAHTNADEFADYRSPTYSIYGLYDPDRKSRADGGY